MSVILFYKRLFTTKSFFLAANITMAFTVAWTLAAFFVSESPPRNRPKELRMAPHVRYKSSQHGQWPGGGSLENVT